MKIVEIKRVRIAKEDRLAFIFQYDNELIKMIKAIKGSIFDWERRFWHVPVSQEIFSRIIINQYFM